MKTAEEWDATHHPGMNPLGFIEAIQKDALQHAAELCASKYEGDGHEAGHANRGVENCEQAIKEAVKQLEANKSK